MSGTRLRRRAQAGEGIVGCIIWAAILAVVVLVLIRMLPIKVNSAELNDFIAEQAKFAGRRTTAAGVKGAVLGKAQQLGLPVTKKDVTVSLGGGRIRIRCTYSVPVDLVVYTYIWNFDHQIDRPVFII